MDEADLSLIVLSISSRISRPFIVNTGSKQCPDTKDSDLFISTASVIHVSALALPAARRLTMITNMADKIILLFIVHPFNVFKITTTGTKK